MAGKTAQADRAHRSSGAECGTPEIAARLIYRRAGYIRARIRDGELRAYRRGGWLIKGEDFLAWLGWLDPTTGSDGIAHPVCDTPKAKGASTSRATDAARMARLSQHDARGSR